MKATDQLALPVDPGAWERVLYSFLAEKEKKTGSLRTVQSYSRMLRHFFGTAEKTPDRVVSPDVLAWAHGIGLSGRQPSATTIGARTARLSSFYKFLIRMDLLNSNPCDALERPKITPSPARGYTADDVRQLLAVVPDTIPGRRDRAIILTLVLTARRRSEVINLKGGDITLEGDRAFYTYRGKGGRKGRRELPRPAYDADFRTGQPHSAANNQLA
jgi:integrase